MGIETALLVGSLASGLLSSMQGQSATQEAAAAEQDELRRQQEEANKRAAEDKSDRALEGDKAAAAATVAMAEVGGAGSLNDSRKQAEIAGLTGLDLARLEGNRTRKIGSLVAAQKSVRQKASAEITAARGKFFGDALSIGGDISRAQTARSAAADAQRRASSVTVGGTRPQGPSGRI